MRLWCFLGELFAAGIDVHKIDLVAQTSTEFATGAGRLAGDLGVVGTQMYMSVEGGELYEIRDGQSVLIGDRAAWPRSVLLLSR